jgi:hypothetical protein
MTRPLKLLSQALMHTRRLWTLLRAKNWSPTAGEQAPASEPAAIS